MMSPPPQVLCIGSSMTFFLDSLATIKSFYEHFWIIVGQLCQLAVDVM